MLSAELLGYIKDGAEKQTGLPVRKVVISVPAYFELQARQATKDAAFIAGFETVNYRVTVAGVGCRKPGRCEGL